MMKHRSWRRVVANSLCLVLVLGLFSGLGVSAHEEVEIITPTRMSSTLVETAEALSAEIGTLPTTGALRNGKVRLYGFSPSADGKNEIKNLRGKHYIIREEADKFYILDGSWTGTNGNLPMKEVTMSARPDLLYIASGYSPAMAFDFNYRGLASNGMPAYVLRFNNGRNLAVGSQYTGSYTNLYYVKQDTTTDLAKAPQIRFYHPAGVGWVTIRNVQGTHGLRQATDLTGLRWKDNSSGNNDNEGNALELYRPWSTKGIIDAIWDMRGYLDTPEFYDEATLEAFISAMRQAIDLFKQYNPTPKSLIDPYNYIQEKLDAAETELRSFADRLFIDVEDPSATELNATTKIHQLPIACGYVIQTRGGKIIVIDGGYQDNNTEGKYLFSYLQKITGDSTPHIDAWFLTHAHADHHGCVPTFADLYKNQVTIDAFYYHYPTYDQISKYLPGCGVDGTWAAVDWLRTWLLPNFKNAEGQPTKEVTVYTDHSGKCNNSFDFDEVHIDILLTFDDIMWASDNVKDRFSATSQYEGCNFSNMTFKELLTDNFNETSTIFRITAGGKNLLITGDTNLIGGYMLEKYHDAHAQNSNNYFTIKSDYVQVSHHGYCGLAKKTYQKIDPDVALFPTNSQEYNDTTLMNLVWHRRWFDEMGVTCVPAYQGPQVIEFPVVRSGGAVSIPTELKSLIFDAEYYSAKYADLAKLYGKDETKLYYHFINYGLEEGRSASPFFDVKFYANQNGAHLRDTFKGNYGAAFKDFLSKYKTGTLLKLSEEFDASFYASNHKDLSSPTNLSLLQHYVANGYKMGEIASNTFVTLEPNVTYHDNCTVTQPVAPTCTTAGKTGGVECKTCGLVLKKQTSISATGHSYSYKVSAEPTTSASGALTGTCSLCSGTTTVTLPKLNDTDYTKTVATAATCTATGVDKYTWKNESYGTFTFYGTSAAKGHTSVADPAVEPTCTTSGKTEGKHCSVCNTVLTAQELIPAKGHTEVIDEAETPTCTTSGKTEGKHCSVCNAVLVAQYYLPATDHTPVVDKAKAPGCTTGGNTEGSHCGVCYMILTPQSYIPPTGHSYTYTEINGEVHLVGCENCKYSAEAPHSYTQGACLCGLQEIKEPVLDVSLKLGHSLNLASDISINFGVAKTLLAGFDMDTVYVESTIEVYEGEEYKGTTTVRIDPVDSGYYYYFTLTGLTAVQMNDTITSVFYGTKDGQPYYSNADVYKIADYAYSQLNKTGASDTLKTLCADLLRYGAKAQIFKSYRTDSLSDSNMTDAHRAYLSDMEAVTFGNTNQVLNDLPNAPIAWAGKGLDLDSKVCLKFIFNPAGFSGDLADLTLKVSYKDLFGEEMNLTLSDPQDYSGNGLLYAFTLDALLASELREVVSVQIYHGNTPVSATLQYSADTYGNNKKGDLLELCKALIAYSDSAKAYFVAS